MGDAGYNSNAEQARQSQISMAAPAVPGAPAPAAGSGSGGFTFDADKIDGVIKKWQDLLVDVKHDAADANAMANIKAPGKEFASGDWEKLANPSGKAFMEQNKKMQDYITNYIKALQDAKKKITTQEAENAAGVQKTGNQSA